MEQQKNKKILMLRISYWTGAVVDLFFGLTLLFLPGITRFLWQLEEPIQGAGLMWTQYFGSIVFAWTFLLLWADRKPLERKGVLLLTAFPVLTGFIAIEVYVIISGSYGVVNPGLLIGMQTALFALFMFSYLYAGTKQQK